MSIKVLIVLALVAVAASSPAPTFLPIPIHKIGGKVGPGVGLQIGSLDLGKGLRNLFGSIIGHKHRARKDLDTILNIKVSSFNDVCLLLSRVAISLCDTIEASITGLGNLLSRVIISFLKIIICILGGAGKSNPICGTDLNLLVGVQASAAADIRAVINVFGIAESKARLNTIISIYTRGRGISACRGSVRYIFQLALNLINRLQIVISGSGKLGKGDLKLVFRGITGLLGAIGNSRQRKLGLTISKNFVNVCNKYIIDAGYPDFGPWADLEDSINACNDDNAPWAISDIDASGGTGVSLSIGGLIGNLFKGLIGVKRLASNLIEDILKIAINSIEDVFNLALKIILGLGGLLDATIAGLGSLLVRIVAGLLKIILCFVGKGKYGVCQPSWDRQVGVTGSVTSIDLVIKLYGLDNCYGQVDRYINTYTKGAGISSTSGSVKILLQSCRTLAGIIQAKKWTIDIVVIVFRHMTYLLGAVGNSNAKGVGTAVCNKFIPACNKYLTSAGYPGFGDKQDDINKIIEDANNDNHVWSAAIDTGDHRTGFIIGGNTGGNTGGNNGNSNGNSGGNSGNNNGNNGNDNGNNGNDNGNNGNDNGNNDNNNGNTGSDNGNTGSDKGNDGSDKGNTGKDKGNTGKDKDNTGKDKGNTDKDKGNTGKDKDNTGKDKDNTGKDKDNTGKDKGNTDKDKGNTGKDKDNTDKDKGNTGKDKDNTGKDKDNTGKDKGNTDKDKGNTGKDKGNTGKDNDNTGKDKGNTGKDKGNTGKEKDNTDKDKGNTGKDKDNTGKDKGNTGKDNDNTGKDKDNTGKDKDNTGKDKGNTDKDKGNTGKDKDNTGKDKDNTGKDKGNTGSDNGDTGSDKGNTGSDKGETGSDKGNTGSDKGDTGSDKGNTGSDKGDTGSDKGDTGSDTGNNGSDKGNTGNDKGDTGSDKGDTGSDKGNTGSDKGDNGSDKGDTGSDTGNNGSDKGNTGGNTGNGNDISVSIGGIIKLIPGCTSISSNIISEIIKIKITTLVDIVNLLTKLAIALGGIIDSIISGLGSILIRIVAVIFKIGYCVNGWGSDRSICTKEWNAQFGITGEASTAPDLIALFRLNKCKNDVDSIVSANTNGRGISATSGILNIILQQVTDLSVIVSSGTITKTSYVSAFVKVISIFGAVTNSYKQGSGTVIIQRIFPVVSTILVKKGFVDVKPQLKTVVSTINLGNNDKFNWSIVKNGGDSNSDKLASNVKKAFKNVKSNNNDNKHSITAVLNLQPPRNFDDVCSFGVQVVQGLGGILDAFINGLGSLIARIVGSLINYIVAVLGAARNAKSFVSQKAYFDSFGVTVSGSTWADIASGFKVNKAKSDLDGILAAYTKNKGLKSLSGAKLVFFNAAYSLVEIVVKGKGIVEADLTIVFRIVTTIIGGFANSVSVDLGKTICDNMLPTVSFYLEKNGYPSLGSQSDVIYSKISTCNGSDAPWAAGTTTTVVTN